MRVEWVVLVLTQIWIRLFYWHKICELCFSINFDIFPNSIDIYLHRFETDGADESNTGVAAHVGGKHLSSHSCQLVSLVYNFINTGWRFGQYRLAIWPIPVGDFVNTGWRFQNVGKKDMHNLYVCIVKFVNTGWWFGQYRLAIWPIPVGDLANTSWQFGQYRLAIWPIPAMVHFPRFGQV